MRRMLVLVFSTVSTLLIALTISFALTRASGNPVFQILGENATDDQVRALEASLGLDQPLLIQYFEYLVRIAVFDLGDSVRYGTGNWELISGRLGATVQLALTALALGVVIGVGLGVLAAVREGTWVDRAASALALVGQSMPAFWVGIMLISVFAVRLDLLPAGQTGTWRHLILPAVTLSLLPMARVARLTRAAVAEAIREPYVTSARSRGYTERRVLVRHVAKNASVPVLTITGLQVGALLSGTVTVELVFAWPGLGSLAVQAVQFRDFPMVQAIVIFGAVTFVAINLMVDVAAAAIDPRIRTRSS